MCRFLRFYGWWFFTEGTHHSVVKSAEESRLRKMKPKRTSWTALFHSRPWGKTRRWIPIPIPPQIPQTSTKRTTLSLPVQLQLPKFITPYHPHQYISRKKKKKNFLINKTRKPIWELFFSPQDQYKWQGLYDDACFILGGYKYISILALFSCVLKFSFLGISVHGDVKS